MNTNSVVKPTLPKEVVIMNDNRASTPLALTQLLHQEAQFIASLLVGIYLKVNSKALDMEFF